MRETSSSFLYGVRAVSRDRAVCLILGKDSAGFSSHPRVSVRSVLCISIENAVCWGREGGATMFSGQIMFDVIAFCTTEITGICFPGVTRIASFEECYF